jgi:hypothetical protein
MPLKEVVGGIYSFQPVPSRWLSLLAMSTPDSHGSLFGACHVSTPVGVWSDLTVGMATLDSPVPHRTCSVCCNFCALTPATHCSQLFTFVVNRWRQVVVALLAHRTVR